MKPEGPQEERGLLLDAPKGNWDVQGDVGPDGRGRRKKSKKKKAHNDQGRTRWN